MFKNRPKIGLALGSGGARGFAHIGVIKVLVENNISIDFIAGASIGAVVGGFYAAKRKIVDLEKMVATTDWKRFISLLDPSLKAGLLSGNKAKEFIESYLFDLKFSDLQIPFATVATDFENGEPVIIKNGFVSSAIRASMSVPLAFAPFKLENKLFVDGGMSMPVPVDVVKKMGADIVIAVNLDGSYFLEKKKKFNYAEVAYRSFNMLRYNLAEQMIREADVVVNPKVGDILWYKFVTGKNALKNGEDAMIEKMPELLNKIKKFKK